MTLDSDTIHLLSRNLMIAGFSIAMLANAWARNWGYVAAFLLAVVESFKRYRFEIHTWAREQMLGMAPEAGAKEILQSKLLYTASMLACLVLVLLIPYLVRANAGRRLMVVGSLTALTVLGLELISPHNIDLIIYHTVGLFALAAILYFCSSIVIACGAILGRRP